MTIGRRSSSGGASKGRESQVKRILTAIAILAVTVMPAVAADLTTQAAGKGGAQQKMQMKGGTPPMQHGPGAMRQMMQNPQHLVMMAYHRNVANFGHMLYQATGQGSTVPAQVARVAIAEMRRSIEEMEKYRAMAMKELQATPRMQKTMDDHLVQLKSQLRELDELAQKDRIDSEEVRKHLEAVFEVCEGAAYGMMPGGPMRWEQMRGVPPDYRSGRAGPMSRRAGMMDEMMRRMKSQDAELETLVQEMQAAPRDRKLDLVSEVVARLVRQRAAMTQEMEGMQRHMMQFAPMGPGMMEGADDEDDEDMEMDMDMEMDDDHPEPK